MAAGEAGVERGIAILSSQVSRAMRLFGVTNLDELNPRYVTQLRQRGPRDS
jgi:L-lactate dehydrogenase (cytochrome)